MPYTFTDGAVATKAQLDTILPPAISQAGLVKVTPVANTPTAVKVTFPTPFPVAPTVASTAYTTVIGDSVKGVSVTNISTTGFTAWVYRTTTTGLTVCWQAWMPVTTLFTTGQSAYSNLLNMAGGQMVCKSGKVTITPVANTPTSLALTFPSAFVSTPTVLACPVTTVPGTTVKGVAVSAVTTTGCNLWVHRTSTSATDVAWIALGRT